MFQLNYKEFVYEAWRDRAVCVGIDSKVFFPEMISSEKVWIRAREYCDSCPVRNDCLESALRYEDLEDKWGMFGGHTPHERSVIRHERRRFR
jgi:WhiB family redox-sensing transcriptional regulator